MSIDAVIASEAKQPRGRLATIWAMATCRPWVASPSARNDGRKGLGLLLRDVEWLVAALVATLAALTLGHSYESTTLVATLAAAPLVAWVVVQDVRSFTIADGAVVALAALALAVRVAAGDSVLLIGLDVALSGGVLLAFRELYFRRRGFDGLGLGDVKLAAAGGLLVGAVAFAWALLAASLLALGVVAVAFLVARLRGIAAPLAGRKLAFGAALAPALYLAWLAQAIPLLRFAG